MMDGQRSRQKLLEDYVNGRGAYIANHDIPQESGSKNDKKSAKKVSPPEISETPSHLASSSTRDVDHSPHTTIEMNTASAKTAPEQLKKGGYEKESDYENKVHTEGKEIRAMLQQREAIQSLKRNGSTIFSGKSDEELPADKADADGNKSSNAIGRNVLPVSCDSLDCV